MLTIPKKEKRAAFQYCLLSINFSMVLVGTVVLAITIILVTFFLSPDTLVDNSAILDGDDIVYEKIIVNQIQNQYLRYNKDHNLTLLTFNGTYPGPTIRLRKGQKLIVSVENHLKDFSTTVHWHGMFLHKKPWNDGVPGITQCPIPPGESYTYEIDTGSQTGTYWYHSHYHGQYVDGLVGPLIIEDPDTPYKYDEDMVLMVSDWYKSSNTTQLLNIVNAVNTDITEPIPEMVLINGKTDITFESKIGKTTLLRFICSSAIGAFNISLSNGQYFDIVEFDGIYLEKKRVQYFSISVAQRVAALVTFTRDTVLTASLLMPIDNQPPAPLSASASFKTRLVPRGLAEEEEYDPIDSDELLVLANLDFKVQPLIKESAPSPVTTRFEFNLTMDMDSENRTRGFLNGRTLMYNHDGYPILSKLLDYSYADHIKELNETFNPIVLDNPNGAVEIVVNNFDGGDHPFHLHGSVLYVLGSGEGVYNGTGVLHLENPTRRDTVVIPAEGWTLFRFWPQNVGAWLCNCFFNFSSLSHRVAQCGWSCAIVCSSQY
jgi:iron transport multicopper oxidase